MAERMDMSDEKANAAAEAAPADTPLSMFLAARGGRMVGFAGARLPLQFPTGIVAEHIAVRTAAGLFDVSHMGQASLIGPDHETTAAALERVVPSDIRGLKPGRTRYTVLLNVTGGIVDDLLVTRPRDPEANGRIDMVVNAARKSVDAAHVEAHLPSAVRYAPRLDRALIALQGPRAAEVLTPLVPAAADLGFMCSMSAHLGDAPVDISRSGYTGEDGFEISVPARDAEAVATALLGGGIAVPVGLGARDSLRLEAGLCLYGHDLDEGVSPVEANLRFVLSKRRLSDGDFLGAERVTREVEKGPTRLRVGFRLLGRVPAREGARVVDTDGAAFGRVTSGGFAPTLQAPIAMGYVPPSHAASGTLVHIVVRGRPLDAEVAAMPFVAHNYRRKGAP